MPQFHAIFVIDRSGSMGAKTLDASKRIMPNLPKDRVGDVFETGVIQFLKLRQQLSMLQNDRYSVICFDGVVENLKWVGKQANQPEDVI